MPIYEYECKKCQHRFEHLARVMKDVPCACPDCGSKNIEKVFSSFGVAMATPRENTCASCPSSGCPHRLNSK